jgi:hypothetical protein
MAIGYHLGFARVHLRRVAERNLGELVAKGDSGKSYFLSPCPSKTRRAEGRPPGSP